LTYILSIDIGTTSTKGLAVATSGEIIALHQVFYPTQYPQPGHVEQDTEVILEAVIKSIEEVYRKLIGHHFLGISFSAAMHSLMAVDENGNPLMPLIIWADTRSTAQSKKIKSEGLAQQLYEATGTPIHPMSPFCKLLWLKENQPALYAKAHKFISIKEFVIHRLTGEYLIDHSTASATGLFDISELKWSVKVLELLQLSEDKFSTPVTIYHQVVGFNTSFIKKMGIDRQVHIIIGASDGCSAQWGSNAMSKGDLSITLGTSGAVRVASTDRMVDAQGGIFNYILDKDFFICGGATNNGTTLLNWYSEKIDPSASTNLVEFINDVNEIPPGSDGLIALPYLQGERAPMYDPDARGVFFGVAVHHTHKHFQRALVEGICYELKSLVEGVEAHTRLSKKIMVSGGITYSPAWLQILCNVLGRSITIFDSHDASAIGAALIGFKAMEIDFTSAKNEEKVFYPEKSINELYEKYFEIFKTLYRQLAPSFEKLGQLKNQIGR
jgi:gluconokinase